MALTEADLKALKKIAAPGRGDWEMVDIQMNPKRWFRRWMLKNVYCRFPFLHDYPIHKGGNGRPWHFYTYTCWNCGKEFTI